MGLGSVNIWKDTVTYDKLTINECQKKDPVYSRILDEVRRGYPSEDSLDYLRKRIITVNVEEKYKELCESGTHPVCFFQHVKHARNIIPTCLVL